jgi:dihydroflavonol-4-reductase
MRIAVTGASGFLGSHISRVLMEAGHEVVAVVRTPSKAEFLGCAIERADLADEDALTSAFAGCEAVVSNAALAVRDRKPSREEFHAANVEGTLRVLRACNRAEVDRVVGISTLGVQPDWAWRRLAAITTNRLYLATKGEGERLGTELALETGLKLTWLRPGPIYGSRDHKATRSYAEWARKELVFAPTVALPQVHASDVGGAVAGALQLDEGRMAYGLAGPSVSFAHLLRVAKSVLGASGRVVSIPVPVTIGYDDSAAREDLGFRPRSIEEGLAEAYK